MVSISHSSYRGSQEQFLTHWVLKRPKGCRCNCLCHIILTTMSCLQSIFVPQKGQLKLTPPSVFSPTDLHRVLSDLCVTATQKPYPSNLSRQDKVICTEGRSEGCLPLALLPPTGWSTPHPIVSVEIESRACLHSQHPGCHLFPTQCDIIQLKITERWFSASLTGVTSSNRQHSRKGAVSPLLSPVACCVRPTGYSIQMLSLRHLLMRD